MIHTKAIGKFSRTAIAC